jgi:hypothetical protein
LIALVCIWIHFLLADGRINLNWRGGTALLKRQLHGWPIAVYVFIIIREIFC